MSIKGREGATEREFRNIEEKKFKEEQGSETCNSWVDLRTFEFSAQRFISRENNLRIYKLLF